VVEASIDVELGIDSASPDASLALMRGDEVLAERRWTIESTFSQELLAAIDSLLTQAGVERTAITAVAVNAGPGGYTGLRTGVATAQGLAFALDVPLAGVSRLEAEALPLLESGGGGEAPPLVVVHDLGGTRGVAWAVYERGGADSEPLPVELTAPRIDSIEDCVRDAPDGARWTGELTEELLAALAARSRAADAEVVESDAVRAASLIRLARRRQAYGDPAVADVIYLRPPSITKPSESGRRSR
jgi:tRNA threonylcarbamoyladenosine biosynthesis protein TsaB